MVIALSKKPNNKFLLFKIKVFLLKLKSLSIKFLIFRFSPILYILNLLKKLKLEFNFNQKQLENLMLLKNYSLTKSINSIWDYLVLLLMNQKAIEKLLILLIRKNCNQSIHVWKHSVLLKNLSCQKYENQLLRLKNPKCNFLHWCKTEKSSILI